MFQNDAESSTTDKVILAVYGLTREEAATESVRFTRLGLGVSVAYPQVRDYDSGEIAPVPGQLSLGPI